MIQYFEKSLIIVSEIWCCVPEADSGWCSGLAVSKNENIISGN